MTITLTTTHSGGKFEAILDQTPDFQTRNLVFYSGYLESINIERGVIETVNVTSMGSSVVEEVPVKWGSDIYKITLKMVTLTYMDNKEYSADPIIKLTCDKYLAKPKATNMSMTMTTIDRFDVVMTLEFEGIFRSREAAAAYLMQKEMEKSHEVVDG